MTNPNLVSLIDDIKDSCWDAQDESGYTACSDIIGMLKHPEQEARLLNGYDITAFIAALYRWLQEEE